MSHAPPAKNPAICIRLKAGGGLEHVQPADEASKTEHEFYIISAACSVRQIAHAHECGLLCVLVFLCWFVRAYGWRAFAQASVYRSHRGGYPAPVDSMRINTKPRMWWVTSRQLPGTFWVDEATERAIYSFSLRDTAAYPEQQYLDHGDLAEDYRAAYSSSTVPKGCIGKKGVGGDYYPTEEQMEEQFAHVMAGVRRA